MIAGRGGVSAERSRRLARPKIEAIKTLKKTGKFTMYPVPAEYLTDETQESMVGTQHLEVDSKVWLNDTSIPGLYRIDLKTGKWERWAPYKKQGSGGDELAMTEPHSVYGIYADAQRNIFLGDFEGENLAKISPVVHTSELQQAIVVVLAGHVVGRIP